jgi:hypothetical protein
MLEGRAYKREEGTAQRHSTATQQGTIGGWFRKLCIWVCIWVCDGLWWSVMVWVWGAEEMRRWRAAEAARRRSQALQDPRRSEPK